MTSERTCIVTFLEEEWTAHYDYSPGRPAVMYLRNGDPGYPEDPPQLCVNRLKRTDRWRGNLERHADTLTEAELDAIEAQCWDAVEAEEDAYWAQVADQMGRDK
jgi:hypothetical protein